MPLSLVFSALIKFGGQFSILLAVLLHYILTDNNVHLNAYILLTPVLILIMAILSLGNFPSLISMTVFFNLFKYTLFYPEAYFEFTQSNDYSSKENDK
jgi:lipopolysaccharide transport system permease protein